MKLIPKTEMTKLLRNGARSAVTEGGVDHQPVIKLFMPGTGMTWLISEIDPENPDIAFGLCDLGQGDPELGSVSINELTSVRGRFGVKVERDMFFRATKTVSVYADDARSKGRISD